MRARFPRPVSPSAFAGIAGVSVTSCDGEAVQLEVTGAIGSALRVIADHDPVDFSCSRASLDELFLSCLLPGRQDEDGPLGLLAVLPVRRTAVVTQKAAAMAVQAALLTVTVAAS